VTSGGFWPGRPPEPPEAGEAEPAESAVEVELEVEPSVTTNGDEPVEQDQASAAEPAAPQPAPEGEAEPLAGDEADTDSQEAVLVAEPEGQPEPEAGDAAEAVSEAEATSQAGPASEAEPLPEVEPPAWEPAPLPEPELVLAGHAPGDLRLPDDVNILEGRPFGLGRAVGVVVSRFNGDVTNLLLESALAELDRLEVPREHVTIVPVPGAFELPLAAMGLAKTRQYAFIVALGCVIRGETAHFDYVAGEAASGLQLAALETGVPVSFGVLTVDTLEQAMARTDKGADAVRSGLEMADLFSQLRQQRA